MKVVIQLQDIFLEQDPELKDNLLPDLRKEQETSSVGAENQIFKIVLEEKWFPRKETPKTFAELFKGTNIKPEIDKNGNQTWNFKATFKQETLKKL